MAVTDRSVVNTIIGVSARSSDHVDIVNTSIVIADSTVKGTVSLARLGGETSLGTSSGNTLKEALAAAEPLADGLADLIEGT